MTSAVDEILTLLPTRAGAFEVTQYPLPVKATILGQRPIDLAALRHELLQKSGGDVKHLLNPLLLAAELVESAQSDRGGFFLTDAKVQGLVFMGSKWRAGWVLVLGDKHHEECVRAFQARNFMVFTDHPGLAETVYIGNRPTSPIYFLQLMVRYGLVWGRIQPGDDHEMGHFLEKDMPGLLCITEDLPPLKYLIALGLMKLGAPAIVPPTYPFPYGNRITAADPRDAVDLANGFANLRTCRHDGEVIALPEYCNPAWANEEFAAASRYGSTAVSFFCLRRAAGPIRPLEVQGAPAGSIGIIVEADHPALSLDVAKTVEAEALKAVNFLKGVRASMHQGVLTVELAAGANLDPPQLAEVIRQGVRLKFPLLRQIGIRIIFDEVILQREADGIRQYRSTRRDVIAAMTEENTEHFCACTECRPFSLEHTCILTPDRLPMCAARTYHSVKAAALLGSDVQPYQRRAEERVPLRTVFAKGQVLDAVKGEYAGANLACQELTHGRIQRVQLHSLCECPHTSCGCFHNLAFWIDAVHGIGIMSRSSPAIAPDGRRWSDLANAAGGKQAPGIMGISTAYIRMASFLKGDGGLHNTVWMDSPLLAKLADVVPPGTRIASEKDVTTVDELKRFLGR